MPLLSVSASFETYEGAQLATFADDAQDMHHFLRALYVPEGVPATQSQRLDPLIAIDLVISSLLQK